MRKLMWLLVAMALWTATPGARAQFGQPGHPLWGRPNIPGAPGGQGPFAPGGPGIPVMPGVYDPLGRSRIPVSPAGRLPGMPPSARDILNQPGPGYPTAGQRFDPWTNSDPLAPFRGPAGGIHPAFPGVRLDQRVQPGAAPPSMQAPQIDPKVLQQLQMPQIDPKVFEHRFPPPQLPMFEPPPAGGGGPPAWLRWEYAVGVLVIAALAGLLHALFRREAAVREDRP